MSSKFERCLVETLRHEGGFVNHPSDPGGATNLGISLRYARSQGSLLDLDKDGDVDVDDIKMVTLENAAVVYRDWFWRDVRGDDLPSGVDLAVFDFAVNSGAGRAIKYLQRVLDVEPDGVFGPKTLEAVKKANPADVINKLCDVRLTFLKGLATWPTFGRGWTNRVNDIHKAATNMIGAPVITIQEVAQTDTARGAGAVAAVGAVATAVAQAEPALKALGALAPWVALALIGAALVGVLIWRLRRA